MSTSSRRRQPWRSQKAFDILCNIIASDSLVCITGAGVSFGLRRRNGGGWLPGWKELLEDLFEELKKRIDAQGLQDCAAILKEKCPPGTRLIELASILRKNNNKRFDEVFKRLVTPKAGACTDKHKALIKIQPRGIITFNYDNGHENAAIKLNGDLEVLLPTDEAKLARALGERLSNPFLLKAHGSIGRRTPLVLTYESYRDLLVKSPAYRAFVQNILTNFHLLIVGFGLSDPDFDVFIDTLVSQYGSPLREHVVIRGVRERSNQEIELRRRYGIHTLYVNDFNHISALLEDAATSASERLKKLLEASVRGSFGARSKAHEELRHLGPAGRKSAVEELKKEKARLSLLRRFNKNDRLNRNYYLSEVAYTLGVIDPRVSKPILMAIVEEETDSIDPAARALTVLRNVLGKGDIKQLIKWRNRFRKKYPDPKDKGHRLVVYTDYLIVYVQAKYSSHPKRAPRGV